MAAAQTSSFNSSSHENHSVESMSHYRSIVIITVVYCFFSLLYKIELGRPSSLTICGVQAGKGKLLTPFPTPSRGTSLIPNSVLRLRSLAFDKHFLIESLTRTKLPGGPGSAPFKKMRLSEVSTRITRRFCCVRRRLPMCPAIFLPGKTRPGSWCCPVLPPERCEMETPCDARRPLNPHLFMTPWKPFPTL